MIAAAGGEVGGRAAADGGKRGTDCKGDAAGEAIVDAVEDGGDVGFLDGGVGDVPELETVSVDRVLLGVFVEGAPESAGLAEGVMEVGVAA